MENFIFLSELAAELYVHLQLQSITGKSQKKQKYIANFQREQGKVFKEMFCKSHEIHLFNKSSTNI